MSSTDLTLREDLALPESTDHRDPVLRTQHRVRLGRRWSTWAMPCLTCGMPTHSRNAAGLPVDACCADQAMSQRLIDQASEWRNAAGVTR